MSRKDYTALASALLTVLRETAEGGRTGSLSPDEYSQAEASITECAWRIADACQADNPRFDRDRFLKACGL